MFFGDFVLVEIGFVIGSWYRLTIYLARAKVIQVIDFACAERS